MLKEEVYVSKKMTSILRITVLAKVVWESMVKTKSVFAPASIQKENNNVVVGRNAVDFSG